jgi:AcrR family transcriptional regulator
MGRRSDHTRDELKEMFIEAGQALVMEEGPHSLNARAVAARIGYSVGTLYNVFENLSDLVMHINLRTLIGLEKTMRDAIASAGINSGRMIGRVFLEYALQHAPLWRLVYEYPIPEGQPFPDWWKDQVEALFQLVEETVTPFFKGSAQELREMTKTYWTGLYGISMLALTGRLAAGGHEPPEVLSDRLYGYLARASDHRPS